MAKTAIKKIIITGVLLVGMMIMMVPVYADEEEIVYVRDPKKIDYEEVLDKVKLEGKTWYELKVNDADEVVEEVPGAKKKANVKTLGGYTNDPKNNSTNSPQLYNNGIMPLHKAGIKGQGIEIAVLDAGMTITPEIEGAIDWTNSYDYYYKRSIKKGLSYKDSHGTSVVGVIAASYGNGKLSAGVAPSAKIIAMNIGDEGEIDLECEVKALQDLDKKLDEGKLPNLKVINLSYGINDTEGVYDVQSIDYYKKFFCVEEAMALYEHLHDVHGITIVAAAGNEGGNAIYYKGKGWDYAGDNATYPADINDVISVAYTSDVYNGLADRSNLRPQTDLVAQGEMATLTKKNGLANEEGSSYSAPVVSGIFALMYSQNKNLSEAAILNALKSTQTSLKKNADGKFREAKDYSGKGCVNAMRAYNKLFQKSLKMDMKYALFKLDRAEMSLTPTTSIIFGQPEFISGCSMYGLRPIDGMSVKYTKKKSGSKLKHTLKVSGSSIITRTFTCTTPSYTKPKVTIKAEKKRVVIKYKKEASYDYLETRIYKNSKLKHRKLSTAERKEGTISYKLPKGKYKVVVRTAYEGEIMDLYKYSSPIGSKKITIK